MLSHIDIALQIAYTSVSSNESDMRAQAKAKANNNEESAQGQCQLGHNPTRPRRNITMGGATGGCEGGGGQCPPHFWDQRGTGGYRGGPMKMIFASTAGSLYSVLYK